MKMKQQGQIALILLLFVLVALTIGLTVTQRSLSNLNTSSQTEQVSRAFTAAEAGLERSLNQISILGLPPPPGTQNIPLTGSGSLNNQSSAQVGVVTNLPKTSQALEYPPVGKDTFAQFWLSDPSTLISPYQGTSLRVYFGNLGPETPRPAIELNLITRDGAGVYQSTRRFYDATTSTGDPRIALNGFAVSNSCLPGSINTSSSNGSLADRNFLCRVDLSIPGGQIPIILRARILYSDIKQPIAVEPVGPCGVNPCSLPVQAAIYSSTGFSGQSQKTIQVFRQVNFLPGFLDFAIFSSGNIDKL